MSGVKPIRFAAQDSAHPRLSHAFLHGVHAPCVSSDRRPLRPSAPSNLDVHPDERPSHSSTNPTGVG